MANNNNNNFENIIDISPLISPRLAVFPGDVPFSRKVLLDFENGDHLGLSSVNTTVHIGAHADAPSHYSKIGVGIDQRSLSYYIGGCQVIEVTVPPKARIYPSHIEHVKILQKRILFKTQSFSNPEQWSDDFNSCSPELIQYLADNGVVLVGIDTPSIDPVDSKQLESHQSVLNHDLAVLEGLVLDHVMAGSDYTLIALPLKIENADASPVRAVLLK
jgi:arylformamidase